MSERSIDVRVQPVGHGEVEDAFQREQALFRQVCVQRGFVDEENVPRVRRPQPTRRKDCYLESCITINFTTIYEKIHHLIVSQLRICRKRKKDYYLESCI